MKTKPDSKWQPVTRKGAVVGYLEVFRSSRGAYMSVPGASRWMTVDGLIRNIA